MTSGSKKEQGFKKAHIRGEDTTTTMGVKAEVAIARSGLAKEDIDFVVLLP
jgi:3-oxoacyl-[acyl-carrier-protein] synthase III